MKKKPSPAQLAARAKFIKAVKSGKFRKKKKTTSKSKAMIPKKKHKVSGVKKHTDRKSHNISVKIGSLKSNQQEAARVTSRILAYEAQINDLTKNIKKERPGQHKRFLSSVKKSSVATLKSLKRYLKTIIK